MSNNNLDYNLLKTFAKVSELGSFTKAAEALKQPKSRVSRAIAKLEKDLSVQLERQHSPVMVESFTLKSPLY